MLNTNSTHMLHNIHCPFLMASSALDLLRRIFVFNDSTWHKQQENCNTDISDSIYTYAALNPLSIL